MEDYERANAREWDLHYKENTKPEASAGKWQVAGASKKKDETKQRAKQQQQPKQQPKPRLQQKQIPSPQKRPDGVDTQKDTMPRRPPPKMIIDVDNLGQQAWRRREPAVTTVRIPDELAMQDNGYDAIARQNGAFIFCEYSRAQGGNLSFGIWGEKPAADATRRAINDWITEWRSCSGQSRSKTSLVFAKVVSLTPKQRIHAEKKWERDVMKQRFRQYPPPGTSFGAIGSFHWPMEYRPEEVLGMNFEALDPIRMECKCYVVFVNSNEKSVFQVFGDANAVQKGLLQIRKTCFQIAARQIPPIRSYLLHWPDARASSGHVSLVPYALPNAIAGKISSETKLCPMGEGGGSEDDDERLEMQTGVSEEQLKITLLRTVPRLHYYRGNIEMRVRFGKFLATQYKRSEDGRYDLEEYENMIEESQFTGMVTKEIGDRIVEGKALLTLLEADELLTPQDAMTTDLAAVKPIYTAIFTFADEAGDLRLAISWVEAQEFDSSSKEFDVISMKWTRLERDSGLTSPILDISLQDLDAGFAWHFDIEAAHAVDEARLPPKVVDFSRSVRIKASKSSTPDKLFDVFHKPYVGHLKSIQQRISYRYSISGSDYTIEVSRFQNSFSPPRRSVILPPEGETTVYEARWGLEVYRMEWDRLFTENGRLKIGERAEWEDGQEVWFPEDCRNFAEEEDEKGEKSEEKSEDDGEQKTGMGFAQLMEKLRRVGKLMKDAAVEEDLIGGMTVG